MSSDQTRPALSAMTERGAARAPDRIALVQGDVRLDYAGLHERVVRCVRALRSLGIMQGDRVGYLGLNSVDYVVFLQAALRIGAITVAVNWRLSAREIEYIVKDARLELLLTEFEHLELAPAGTAMVLRDAKCSGKPDFASWIDGFAPDHGIADIAPDDIALQLYTSGTTGNPKGALLSHGALEMSLRQGGLTGEAWAREEEDDVSLIAMPQFHIGGTAWTLQILSNGTTGVILDRPDITSILAAIMEHGITKLFAVPAVLGSILDHSMAATADLSRVRVLLYGASPIPLPILKRSMVLFPRAQFVQMYGATETCGTTVYLPPEDHEVDGNRRMSGCGKPYPDVEMRVVGGDGRPLAAGKVGEVQIRSGLTMQGYHNLPDATAGAFDGGWYRTGDAGSLDADGYLYLFDRVKDMICSGAENIYPAEVENILHDHPEVRECAVIGVPDDRWGEAVTAIVIRVPGSSLDEASLIAFARSRIATFKAPKSVRFVDELPRNPSGKILKRELRRAYWPDGERLIG